MLLIECKGCGTRAFGECTTPPGGTCDHDPCPHLTPDTHFDLVTNGACKCCPEDHDHRASAECSPETDHPGTPCALGVPGCSVCRPLTISALPGSVTLRPVAGV